MRLKIMNNLKNSHDNLIRKTIKAYLDKHEILYNNCFLYKNDLVIFDSDDDNAILNFLLGYDCACEVKNG